MKKGLFLLLVTLLFAVGCQKELESSEIGSTGIDNESFYAEIEQPGDTKTYIDEFLNVRFQKGDQIAIFNNSTLADRYLIEDSADGETSGKFNKVHEQGGDSFDAGVYTNAIVAYYPYTSLKLDATNAEKGNYILKGIALPSTQSYDALHLVSQNSLPMLSAKTDDDRGITFRNICGVLKLNIKGFGSIKSISVKGNNGEKICGKATVSIRPDEMPLIAMDDTAADEVTLDCGETGVALDPDNPKPFMIVLPPVKFGQGFQITVTDTEGVSKVKNTSTLKEIKRSMILNMKDALSFGNESDLAPAENLDCIANGIAFKMIKVNGGTFTMGATNEQGTDAEPDEKPVHRVTLSGYYIGQCEVTQELWKAVMGTNPSKHQGNPKCPVENVTWNDIVNEFLPKLNSLTGKTFMLPTEAQWEFAARGGNLSAHYKYSGSDVIDDVAWYDENGQWQTHEVALKIPNELGLYDMSGNVYEWCSDWNGAYGSASQKDPSGPVSGNKRVLRGGGYDYHACRCRVSYRYFNEPEAGRDYFGLRLALPSNIAI